MVPLLLLLMAQRQHRSIPPIIASESCDDPGQLKFLNCQTLQLVPARPDVIQLKLK